MGSSLMVGYLQSWSSNVTFTDAANYGYTAIVLAFGSVNGTKVDIYDGKFVADPTTAELRADITKAKQSGAKQILISFGGGNNTYEPNGAPIDELASNMVNFCKENGFTGIDFDLEINGDADYLDQLCAAIKEQDETLLLTAAPQINQGAQDTDLILVSTGN
ncbi:MAG: glycoside hydrolase family 18 protein, partial [Kangiellaceae bacterium]|nr:glycoside hydrolase family 18 protein [Kangiellaceae bacterium]